MSKPPSRDQNAPAPGFYLVRLVPKGWECAARIWLADGIYRAEVNGIRLACEWVTDQIDGRIVEWKTGPATDSFERLVIFGKPCTQAQYEHRLAFRDWALMHSPRHPAANPLTPIDPRVLDADDF
jgi:hypothetical protein